MAQPNQHHPHHQNNQHHPQTTEANGYTGYYYYLPEGGTYSAGDLEGWLGEGGRQLEASRETEGNGGEGGGLYHTSLHERGFIHSARIGTVITVCNILLNLLVIILVLLRRSTRVQFVYQQIVNLALSDLAFSVMVDPFTVYFELQPWRLSQGYCVAWMVLDAALPFVSFLVLITLNVDRLMFAVSPALYHTTFRRALLRGLVFLLPWGLGLGILVPLWLLTAVAWPEHGICLYGITKKAAVASAVMSLYVPCVLLIILSVLTLVTIIGGMPQDVQEISSLRPPVTHAPSGMVRQGVHVNASTDLVAFPDGGGGGGLEAETPEVKENHRRVVVAVCVLNLLTVITQLPYGAISMLEPECVEPSCHSTIKLIQALSWMRSVTFSLHPICILFFTRIRQTCLAPCSASHPAVSSHDPGYPGIVVTPCTTSKSDQIELTSVSTSMATMGKGPTTML
ncbi:hypothetical protein ACOMHN_060524 [Nucella lapillus]